jgi:Retroviral aspartyl protease
VQRLFKKRDNKPATTPSALPAQKKFFFSEKKDPNAMDIDCMSIEEHTRLMKEGRCFRCKLFGHLSRDCPNKGQNRGRAHPDPYCIHEQGRKEGLGRRRWKARFGFLKWRTASMSAPPVYIFSVHESNDNSFHIKADIVTPEKNELIKTRPLVNSGAGGTFMNQNYAWKHGFNLTKLEYPITARNVDGTENKQGTIQYYTNLDLQVNGKTNMEQFLITGLGNQKIILGLPWLREHNPEINWKEGTLQ